MPEPENRKAEQSAANTVRVQIDFDTTTSQILITGPTDNLPLFLGMLETAKFVVLQERVKAASKLSIIPGHTPFDPRLLKTALIKNSL